MPRGPRLDAPGTWHHVIVRGIERRKIVDSDKDREDFVARLGLIIIDFPVKRVIISNTKKNSTLSTVLWN